MNEKVIDLKFDKLDTNLAGNRLGNDVFAEQIEPYLEYNKVNIAVFPETIEDIASSFIEGMYKKLGEKYGKSKAIQIMLLDAKNKEAKEKISESIETFGV